jgi:hypothetical protein
VSARRCSMPASSSSCFLTSFLLLFFLIHGAGMKPRVSFSYVLGKGFPHSYILSPAWLFLIDFIYSFIYFAVLGLNSGPTPWATTPALFCAGYFLR